MTLHLHSTEPPPAWQESLPGLPELQLALAQGKLMQEQHLARIGTKLDQLSICFQQLPFIPNIFVGFFFFKYK